MIVVVAVDSFKDLIVWQKSMMLVKDIYKLTSELPKEETYGLKSQMRRCAVSIPSNIAEGSRRGSRKDFAQFLRISMGSASELETQILLSKDLYSEVDYGKTEAQLIEIQKMLMVLIKRLKT